MANITHKITLSTTRDNYDVGAIKVRRADDETQIFDVEIIEDGKIKPFTGLTPFFCLMAREITGQGVSEEPVKTFDAQKGTLKHTLSANAFQMVGRNEAYFSFRKELSTGEWVEQYSTRSFYYTVEKSIYTEPFKDSNYWFTFKELYRLFNQYMEDGKASWEDFFKNGEDAWQDFIDQNREILESIDPGGVILGELIDSRENTSSDTFPSLSERLKTMDKTLGMISFTFDGAFAEDKLTKSIFEDYGFVCNFAPPTDWINIFNGVEFYKQAQREGFGIEAFTRTHRNMVTYDESIDERIIEREIVSSADIYEEMGIKTTGFVSPNSRVAVEYEKYIYENYDYAINGMGVQDNSMRAVQDPLVNDRYHLVRMSLNYNTIESIKAAIDKTVKEKKFLLFYDHKTGSSEAGNVTEAKLREVLEYIKTNYTDTKKAYVCRLADVISAKYENSLARDYKSIKHNSLNFAPPIGKIGVAGSVPYYGYWGYGTHGSTTTQDTCTFDYTKQAVVLDMKASKLDENRSVQMCLDLTDFKGDQRPHSIYFSLPIWLSSLEIKAEISVDCRFYDIDGNMIGATKVNPLPVTDERLILGAEIGVPRDNRNFSWAHVYVRVKNLQDNTGQIFLQQPSVTIDDSSYSGKPASDYSVSGLDFSQFSITADRKFQWLNVETQYDGINLNGRQHFGVTLGSPEFVVKISGLYEFRLETWATLLDEATTLNGSFYVEVRINNNNVDTADANHRFSFLKQNFSSNGQFGGQMPMSIPLKAGDRVRLAVFKNATGGTLASTKKPYLTIQKIGNY